MSGLMMGIAPAKASASGRPADMPWLSPFLTVQDARTSLKFYEDAFGFAPRETKVGPDGLIYQAAMNWRDAVILFGPKDPESGNARPGSSRAAGHASTLYVYCDDVDAFYARAMAAGATSAFKPMDASWGDRICKLIDPDGHAWNFAARLG
ncbi:VOC family protein [Tundrisphaera sp. TA3]|uniref:VOC family protein n=1 Tax=Tundrisphaera sp. TA3 TaxID=3435775 RepID=UPI003EBB382B